MNDDPRRFGDDGESGWKFQMLIVGEPAKLEDDSSGLIVPNTHLKSSA